MTQGTEPASRMSLWGARRAPLPQPPSITPQAVAPPQPALTQTPDERIYQAFETHERAGRLNIRSAMACRAIRPIIISWIFFMTIKARKVLR